MQEKRKLTASAIIGILLTALFLMGTIGAIMSDDSDRPEPLASVELDPERQQEPKDGRASNRGAAGNAWEQKAHDVQDATLDGVEKGVDAAKNFDYEGLKEDSKNAWDRLKEGFGSDDSGLGMDQTPSDTSTYTTYSREAFGDGWSTAANGCSVRDNILDRDLDNVTKNGCVVESGTLDGQYTGEVTEHQRGTNGNPSQVHIDHIVPLAYAWEHGASEWSDADRVAFANDPANLQAVNGRVNTAKSDQGPSEWMPSINQCAYAQDFTSVAADYGLDIPAADANTVDQYC